MPPIPHDAIGWRGGFQPSQHHGDEFGPFRDLLFEDTSADNGNDRRREPGSVTEFTQLCEDPTTDWETQWLFPDLCGIKQQAEMRDTPAIYFECEVNRSEVTRSISVGGGEEISVVHMVQRRILRWQGTTAECNCRFEDEERAPASHFDATVATCGFFQHQQVPPSHPLPGGTGHRQADRPVGDLREIGRYRECSSSNIPCDFETYCDTSDGCRHDEQRPLSRLTECDTQFYDINSQTLRESTCSGREDQHVGATDKNDVDPVMRRYIEWKKHNLRSPDRTIQALVPQGGVMSPYGFPAMNV